MYVYNVDDELDELLELLKDGLFGGGSETGATGVLLLLTTARSEALGQKGHLTLGGTWGAVVQTIVP